MRLFGQLPPEAVNFTLLLGNDFDQHAPLIAQERQFFHFLGANERMDVVNVIPGPILEAD